MTGILNKKFSFPNFLQVLFLISLIVDKIKSDLPVHCLRKDVVGLWEIKISKRTFTPSLTNEQITSCGHGLPNKVISLKDDSDLIIPDYTDLKLELRDNYKVYENSVQVGTWTFVYDQSFIIYYKDSIFTAPFKYYKDPFEKKAVSNCSKSFLGWYIPDSMVNNLNWSCFYAIKSDNLTQETKSYNFLQISIDTQNFNEYIDKNINFPVKPSSFIQTKVEVNLEHFLKYENMKNAVEKINKLDLGWKADIQDELVGLSFFQLKHKLGLNKGKYSKKNSFEDTSFIQLNTQKENKESVEEFLQSVDRELNELDNKNKSNIAVETINQEKVKEQLKKSKINLESKTENLKTSVKVEKIEKVPEIQKERDSSEVSDFSEISKYFHVDVKDIDENKIPKNWDWRNVNGVNYVPPVREQGSCGSCYVFSTITSLESRLRILTNNQDKTLFSKQFPLSCNFYSEGCDGGYPVLVAKFFNEFEIVPEDCFKYTQTNDKCSNVCDYTKNPKKYKVSKFGYLGGFYGGTSEADMIKELRARGPIPGNIVVHWSFHYYKNGIFSQTSLKKNVGSVSNKRLIDSDKTWSEVQHSITLVGYGEENGTKYWIGMNTWGERWGENGYFRILRGENESEIESMGDFMNIHVENRN